MADRVHLLPFVVFLCGVMSVEAQDFSSCTEVRYNHCMEGVLPLLHVADSFFPPYTVGRMRTICGEYRMARTCIAKFEAGCTMKTRAELQSSHSYFAYICDEHFAGFISHRNCLVLPALDQRVQLCHYYFTQRVGTTDVSRHCGQMHGYIDCVTVEVRTLCGSLAAQWVMGLSKAKLQPVLSLGGCDLDVLSSSYCTLQNLHVCYEPLKKHNFSPENSHVVPNFTPGKMKAICQSYKQVRPCVDTLLSNCHPLHSLELHAAHDSYKYVCDDHFDDYVKHRDCLATYNLLQEGKTCLASFDFGMSTEPFKYGTSKYRLDRLCQHANTYVDCVENLVHSFCGQEAASWQRGLHRANFAPLLDYINCTLHSRTDLGLSTVISSTHNSSNHWVINISRLAYICVPLALVLLFGIIPSTAFCCTRKKTRLAGRAPTVRELQPERPGENDRPAVIYNVSSGDMEIGVAAGGFGGVPVPPPYSEKETNFDNVAYFGYMYDGGKGVEAGEASADSPPLCTEVGVHSLGMGNMPATGSWTRKTNSSNGLAGVGVATGGATG